MWKERGGGDENEDEEEDLAPSSNLEEIRRAIRRIKNNKALGVDNIPGELIKYGGRALVSVIRANC